MERRSMQSNWKEAWQNINVQLGYNKLISQPLILEPEEEEAIWHFIQTEIIEKIIDEINEDSRDFYIKQQLRDNWLGEK